MMETLPQMSLATEEIRKGRRFGFGQNWLRYLDLLDEDRIRTGQRSLLELLEMENLSGMTFLDVGSGSGLFSLAARRSGAQVHSFDFDPASIACTNNLKARYFPSDDAWTTQEGSILDQPIVQALPSSDIVYSWGVLHHTGSMWQALRNVVVPVKPGGLLCIALYNDQGWASKFWTAVKRLYCSGSVGRLLTIAIFFPYFVVAGLISDLSKGTHPLKRYREYQKQRGMSVVRDWFDWLGGYPFEVAKPRDVITFYEQFGFRLKTLRECGSNGCNEFVFKRQR